MEDDFLLGDHEINKQEMIYEYSVGSLSNETTYDNILLQENVKSANGCNSLENQSSNKITCEYFAEKTLVELSQYSWGHNNKVQHYLRGCKWSPDGTCILAVVNGDGMHVSELPQDLYTVERVNTDRSVDILTSAIHVKECGTVYDFCWYPRMSSYSPDTCCWATTTQHGPVQIWDAFNGTLRCSYRGYNAVDEVEAALCLTFSPDGTKIIAGYKKSIKIFQTDRPGREVISSLPLEQPASCTAHNPVSDILAVGSWKKSIILTSVQNDICKLSTLNSHKGGVTHLVFSRDGNMLFSGARKDSSIHCWDIRSSNKPLYTLHRGVETNQRIYLDVSPCGKWLISGDTKGIVRAWNIKLGEEGTQTEIDFPVHEDCCNGVAFHPSRPIIATSSGQHHFEEMELEELASEIFIENSLNFWWIGNVKNKELPKQF